MLSALPSGASVLDVGCGDGKIAKLLTQAGLRVTAIDGNEQAVAEAAANDVSVEHIQFLQFNSSTQFDAILFARSLHHIFPLGSAAEHARSLLSPTGLLLVDDFCPEQVDMGTATWFFGLRSLISSRTGEFRGRGPKLEAGTMPANPLETWREHLFGTHQVAESTAVLAAIRAFFAVRSESRLPHLYRYFLEDISEAEAHALFEWEKQLCHLGTIRTIGLRVVARAHT